MLVDRPNIAWRLHICAQQFLSIRMSLLVRNLKVRKGLRPGGKCNYRFQVVGNHVITSEKSQGKEGPKTRPKMQLQIPGSRKPFGPGTRIRSKHKICNCMRDPPSRSVV